jgi:hypothetical protein
LGSLDALYGYNFTYGICAPLIAIVNNEDRYRRLRRAIRMGRGFSKCS